jgi:hypothetical protein
MNKYLKAVVDALLPIWHVPAGIFTFLISLWGGCLIAHYCPDWMNIPVCVTMFTFMILGVILTFKNADWTSNRY